MGTPDVPAEVVSDRLSRTLNKRIVMVIVLSAILVVLGSITLTSSAFWKKVPSHIPSNNSGTPHAVIPTQTYMPTPQSTSSPTKTPVHAPVLGYPLFNGNTHLTEIALT